MKKEAETKKLPLKKEKIRKLDLVKLEQVIGGYDGAGGGGASHRASGYTC